MAVGREKVTFLPPVFCEINISKHNESVRFVEREKSLSSSGFICNFGFQLIVGVFYALFLRVMKQIGDYCFQGSANPLEFHDRRN
jgi:hypothetical protein